MVSMVSVVSATSMINKADEIRKLLKQGWTTREIAHELRVSLRDIHTVREQEGIDIRAIERRKTRIEKDLVALNTSVAQRCSTIALLKKQINDLGQVKTNLEAEIEKKQAEIKYVQQPVQSIYIPKNYGEVEKSLETLSLDQLRSISQIVTNIINDRLARAIHEKAARIRKDTQDNINRTRRSLRL